MAMVFCWQGIIALDEEVMLVGSRKGRREKEEAREDIVPKKSDVAELGPAVELNKSYSKSDVVVEIAQMIIDVVRFGQRISQFFRSYLKKRPLT